jgi:transmembrane 9 superfamily protein 2/4
MARLAHRFLLLVLCICAAQAFYLPGVAPVNFDPGEKVELKVNKLTSVHTQLPYKYYSLPFCKPAKIIDKVENLGEILRGDRIENSPYQVFAKVDEKCKVLCPPKEYSKEEVKQFAEKVGYEYRVHWIVDNLPAAIPKTLQDANGSPTTVYEVGFPLGFTGEVEGGGKKEHYINNHVQIKLLYHEDPALYQGLRIVGFEVEPASIQHSLEFNVADPAAYPGTCTNGRETAPFQALVIPPGQDKLKIVWTYSVTWEERTATPWSNRWDQYLLNTDPQIHWFSIINSLMIVLFLTGMVAMIMMRTLHADLRRYNSMDANEEAEETGWKLVHGDVFRPPTRPMLLSVLIGSGVQVFSMTLITLIFAVLGFLSPANRGGLGTAMVVLFVVMGVFAGYFSTRSYRMMKGQNWKKNTFVTAMAFPGTVFCIFFVLNLFIWGEKSSGAVPFGTLVALVALWFGISVPLVFFGSYFAFKKPVSEPPVRTNQIPRQIPEQVWYMSPIFSVLMGGILPFGAVFIELFFILSAIWGQQLYYIFGFLFIVFIILILTCAEITIVMCYFQLCSEDYHWWWRSYLTAGASAFYMFLYSIFYFFTKLEIETFVSTLLYFGYTFIMALAFFVLTGTIGFYACYLFVRKIYSQVKVD